VTSNAVQNASGDTAGFVRSLRTLAVSPALIVLLLGGLALRLTIAYVLFPEARFKGDILSFGKWSIGLDQFGPGGFYQNIPADYPPASLLALWPVGWLARITTDSAEAALELAQDLAKTPTILADVVAAYVIYRLVIGWAWPGRRAELMALAAAALYLFNPAVIYDSAVWGQYESFGAVILLLGVAALIRGNSEGAAAIAVTAALVKPQFGVVLLSLVGLVLLKRHLFRPGSGPRHPPWGPRRIAGWLSEHQGPRRLLTSAIAAAVAFFVFALPFGLGPYEAALRMRGSAGLFPGLSVNAWNMWAFVGSDGKAPLFESLSRSADDVPLLGPIPGVVIGAILLAVGYLWTVWRAAARDDRWTLLIALAVLIIFFFALPTRVHERYLVPVLAVLPLLAVGGRKWIVPLVLLSGASLANMHGVLAKGVDPLGLFARSSEVIATSAVTVTVVGLWAAWQLRPSLQTSPDGFDRASADRANEDSAAHPPRHDMADS
jgi:dolichyl-phosphate-mannose-protein mannosyltransferase